jgi:Sulfotransferase domain
VKAAAGVAWPTVIIGGAPRSGTSSLYDRLHDTNAFGRRVRKELFLLNDASFWIQGQTPGYAEVGERCYERAGFRRGERFVDASTTYLYQDTAPAACARRLTDDPAPPFLAVFCLREPAERLYSNFRYFRDVLLRIPAGTAFAAYVDALFEGRWHSGNQQVDAALEHGDYPLYLKRWAEAVGEARILVVRTEKLAHEPQAAVAEIGARIGLPLAVIEGGAENASYRPRFMSLHALARKLGDVMPHGALRERLKAAYVRAVPKQADEAMGPQDLGALERVRDYYRERRADFAAFGLDWYRPA